MGFVGQAETCPTQNGPLGRGPDHWLVYTCRDVASRPSLARLGVLYRCSALQSPMYCADLTGLHTRALFVLVISV